VGSSDGSFSIQTLSALSGVSLLIPSWRSATVLIARTFGSTAPTPGEDRMLGRGPVEHRAVGQLPLAEITIGAPDEIVRLTDRRRHDPRSGRYVVGPPGDPVDDVLVRAGVGKIDQWFGQRAKCIR